MLEKEIEGNEEAVTFKVRFDKGKTLLVNDFIEGGEKYGFTIIYARKVE